MPKRSQVARCESIVTGIQLVSTTAVSAHPMLSSVRPLRTWAFSVTYKGSSKVTKKKWPTSEYTANTVRIRPTQIAHSHVVSGVFDWDDAATGVCASACRVGRAEGPGATGLRRVLDKAGYREVLLREKEGRGMAPTSVTRSLPRAANRPGTGPYGARMSILPPSSFPPDCFLCFRGICRYPGG